jgi:NADPH:quinone reductase-like Zn-dependent oxidoreductase
VVTGRAIHNRGHLPAYGRVTRQETAVREFRSIDQQVVAVTGASSGIGRAAALAAAKRGAEVVIAAAGLAILKRRG